MLNAGLSQEEQQALYDSYVHSALARYAAHQLRSLAQRLRAMLPFLSGSRNGGKRRTGAHNQRKALAAASS